MFKRFLCSIAQQSMQTAGACIISLPGEAGNLKFKTQNPKGALNYELWILNLFAKKAQISLLWNKAFHDTLVPFHLGLPHPQRPRPGQAQSLLGNAQSCVQKP
jgi:hypothetical protein